MKKILVAASLLLSVASFAAPSHGGEKESESGKHISASQVPGYILSAFWSSYPYATNVKWEVEREHGQLEYKVEFVVNGRKMKLRYR